MPQTILVHQDKRCSQCGEQKPLHEFAVDRSLSTGHKGRCKACDAERCRAYYAIKRGESGFAYTSHQESRAAAAKRPPRKKRTDPLTAAHNRRVATRNKHHRRRAVMRYSDAAPADLRRLLESASSCPLCQQRMTTEPSLRQKTIDHIIPINTGGTHTLGNLRVLCLSCNAGRPKDGSDLDGYQPTLWSIDPHAAKAVKPTRRRTLTKNELEQMQAQARRMLRRANANVAYLYRLNGAAWSEIVERFGFGGAGHAHNVVFGGDGRSYAPGRVVNFNNR